MYCVVNTKATAQLSAFVFTYVRIRISHDATHFSDQKDKTILAIFLHIIIHVCCVYLMNSPLQGNLKEAENV